MEQLDQFLATAKAHPLKRRGITQASCKKWDYLVRKGPQGYEQIAVYHNPQGQRESAKVRGEDKAFNWVGPKANRGTRLYGQHLWSSGGKSIVITEGELDAISVSQVFDHKYPVVSIPNGAAQAAKAIAANLEWVSSFDKVVLMFDMDTPGREASEAVAKVLPPGKAFNAKLPLKDANECLVAGQGAEIVNAFWRAEPYRPDGLLDARTLTEACLKPTSWGIPWPWKFMTDWTYGRRPGESIVWGGGTGIGKTDFLAEIIACTISGQTRDDHAQFTPEGCVVFTYETGPVVLKKAITSKIARRRFNIPKDSPDADWTDEELNETLHHMDTTMWTAGGKLFINDCAGAPADWEAVKDRSRYAVRAEGVKHIFVDPISALTIFEDDERRAIDKMIMEASHLALELNATLYMASHLNSEGTGESSHEEGARVTLKNFRGSKGITMFVWYCFGMERDQQAENPEDQLKTTIRALKDRPYGNCTGKTAALYYNRLTGTQDVPALAPGMTDLMVAPESLDKFMEDNPLPPIDPKDMTDVP